MVRDHVAGQVVLRREAKLTAQQGARIAFPTHVGRMQGACADPCGRRETGRAFGAVNVPLFAGSGKAVAAVPPKTGGLE